MSTRTIHWYQRLCLRLSCVSIVNYGPVDVLWFLTNPCRRCCCVYHSQLQAVRKDCAATLQNVVDVAQNRWVKLLASRTNAHTRLKLYELKQLLDLSEQVTSLMCCALAYMVEIGGDRR